MSEQVGDHWLRAYTLNDLGLITHLLGDAAEAKRISLESPQIFQAIDDRRDKAFVYSNLGLYASHIQAEKDALLCYEESHRLRELNHDHWGMANALIRVGAISRSLGDAGSSELNLVKAIYIAHSKQFLPVLLDAMIEFALLFEQRGKLLVVERILSVCLAQSSLRRETHPMVLQMQGRLHGSS